APAGANSGANREVNKISDFAAVPVSSLADGGQVDVVLEGDARPQLSPDGFDQSLASPTGQVRRHKHHAPLGVENPGAAQSGRSHLVPADTGVGGQLVGEGADLSGPAVCATPLRPRLAAGDDCSRQV